MKRFPALSFAFLLIFSILLLPAQAAPVDMQRAWKVAENWLDHQVENSDDWSDSAHYPRIHDMETLYYNEKPVAYNFIISPRGHILVSAHDTLPPIKLFSHSSTLRLNRTAGIPPFFTAMLQELSHLAEMLGQPPSARDGAGAGSFADHSANTRLWYQLEKRREQNTADGRDGDPGPSAPVFIGPLVTSLWGQSYPFNLETPLWHDGSPTLVGCVATATTQIMHYHRWPPMGRDSIDYEWNNGNETITLQQNFSTRTYDWHQMPDAAADVTTTLQQKALSMLAADVAMAFQMEFGPTASMAFTDDILTVLPRYFRYKDTIEWAYRAEYMSDSAWMNLFRQETENGRPAILSIAEEVDGKRRYGHAVVVSGYRSDPDQIHIHMGWNGQYDGWYASNNIQYTESGNPLFNFNWFNQGMARNIEPYRSSMTSPILTVQASGTESVIINSTPTGYGGTTPYVITHAQEGSTFTLTAPLQSGESIFQGWSGCPAPNGRNCTITMDSNRVVTALYLLPLAQALNNGHLIWESLGEAEWFGDTSSSAQGGSAARSGMLRDNQQSILRTGVNGPGTLRFNWMVSSEKDYDFLEFSINGEPAERISGHRDWETRSFALPGGDHVLEWTYRKDEIVSSGKDAGWVDHVRYEPLIPSGSGGGCFIRSLTSVLF
ncbi:C10 family peptidase [Desulfobotulus sp. H1]|uniref:C10 family peptidase n=1 Tax=Desulfobotulus pelophilus TaxID=2823377 RepID=A0ABT3N689_9BACT|nr:C10 family peptidase [Desulfobotulus pelophilus]MCW7752975.1 C10 family peptidase [Desulfobotulus pelophilus]